MGDDNQVVVRGDKDDHFINMLPQGEFIGPILQGMIPKTPNKHILPNYEDNGFLQRTTSSTVIPAGIRLFSNTSKGKYKGVLFNGFSISTWKPR